MTRQCDTNNIEPIIINLNEDEIERDEDFIDEF